MSPGRWLSVAEVAEDLEVSAVVVRGHLSTGVLTGRRLGRQWLIDARSVAQFKRDRPQAGRPLSPTMAWAVLLAASGDRTGAAAAAGSERGYYRALRWLREHSLVDDRSRLRRRAQSESFAADPADAARISRGSDVLRSGLAAGRRYGVLAEDQVLDAYASRSRRDELVARYDLKPGRGVLRLRWLPDGLWPLLAVDDDGVAPRAAVLLDLLEAEDPRVRRKALRALPGLPGLPARK